MCSYQAFQNFYIQCQLDILNFQYDISLTYQLLKKLLHALQKLLVFYLNKKENGGIILFKLE
jgi:hypothetical protein